MQAELDHIVYKESNYGNQDVIQTARLCSKVKPVLCQGKQAAKLILEITIITSITRKFI